MHFPLQESTIQKQVNQHWYFATLTIHLHIAGDAFAYPYAGNYKWVVSSNFQL